MDFLGDKFQMLKWFRKEFPNTISKRTLPMASTGSSPMSACSLFPCTSRITCFCFWMQKLVPNVPSNTHYYSCCALASDSNLLLICMKFRRCFYSNVSWPLGMPLFYCCVSFRDLEKMLSAKNPHSFQ